MSMFDDFDEIAFQVNIEGAEQDEEPREPYPDTEEQDEEPVIDYEEDDGQDMDEEGR